MNYDSYMVSNQGLISGTETRISAQARYDDGKTSFSLGTNFWAGLKGVNGESLNQRTGMIGFKSGDFNLRYENDGSILGLGDGGDSYRTAHVSIGIKSFSAGFNIFTGYRDYEGETPENGYKGGNRGESTLGNFDKIFPYGIVKEEGRKYRLGALYLGYKNFIIGTNSEHVSHAIQGQLIHGLRIRLFGKTLLDKRQRAFQLTSWDWKSYFQYQTPNPFTSW